MTDSVKLCIDCKHFQQRTTVLKRLGFQTPSFCASPDALRNSAFSLVHGQSTQECQSMRASAFACGLAAAWFVPKEPA